MARKKTSTSKSDAKSKVASVIDDVKDQVQDAAEFAEDVGADEAADAEPAHTNETSPKDGDDVLRLDEEYASIEDQLPDGDAAETDDAANDPSYEDDPDEQDEAPTVDEHVKDFDTTSAPDPEVTKTAVKQKGGFIPLLLGGMLAGGIGFGASYYWGQQDDRDTSAFQKDVSAKLDQNAANIAGLNEAIANLPEVPNVQGMADEQGNLAASLDSLVNRLNAAEEQFSALDDRLTQVEKRPISEGASDAAVAAYERELKALQDTMAAQRAELEAMAFDAQSMESNAEETAKATMLRAALSRVQTALDSGGGFAPALGDLQDGGIEIPTALSDVAEEGVASLAQLQESFPNAARAALAVSRQEAAENGEESGFSAFLKNQLGTRSLEPREGDDPDAVLSRAEAAAKEGRLADTLAEIEALPEAGRTALSDWTSNVTRRQAAVSAAEVLGQELN